LRQRNYKLNFTDEFTQNQIKVIEQVVETELQNLLNIHPETDIKIKFKTFYKENEYHRFSAAADEPKKMWFKVNTYIEDMEGMITKYLPSALAHEFHHMIRWNYINEYHLAELIIMEGLAIHFAIEVTNSEIPLFVKPVSDDLLQKLLPKVKEDLLDEDFNNRIWQHGSEEFGIPNMFAYSLGYKLVKEYFEKHQERKASNCFGVDCRKFLPESLKVNLVSQNFLT
jgi:Predicted Zn-dependent protease (DUF2268)